jgi:hypothetical protein
MKYRIEAEFPPGLEGRSPARTVFQQVMLESVHSAFDPMLEVIRSRTEYASIREGYEAVDYVAGGEVGVAITNSVRHQPFRENDCVAHWPPWGPGTDLERWAVERGIPPYLVARKISRVGTKGNYVVRDTWREYQTKLRRSVQEGLVAYALESLGFGGRR